MANSGGAPSLEVQPYEHTYTHLASAWPRGPRVTIVIAGAANPVLIPIAFLQSCGHNTWEMVLHMLHTIVDERGKLVSAGGDEPLDPQAEPVEGDYRFVSLDGQHFTWTRGPQGSRRGRAVVEGESDERSSISAASTVQSLFRNNIISRDGYCLLSDRESDACQAAHLVPKARTDIYASLFGELEAVVNPYHMSTGILLRSDLHKDYDMFNWSLYFKDDVYHVHVFSQLQYLQPYHGKQITAVIFSSRTPKTNYPDPVLCNWHYAQCCMMHFRGFSAGMAVNAF